MTGPGGGVAGAPLAHRWDGPEGAPVLVLGNSLGTTVGLWDAQLPAWTAHFRVLRFDVRGHGATGAPPGPYTIEALGRDLLALLDRFELGPVAYCGISLGGMIGMWLATEQPERVDRLVLAATAPVLGPADGWHDRAAAVRRLGTASLVETLVGRWFPPGFADAHPEVTGKVAAMISGCDDEGYASCCEAVAAMDLRPRLGAVTAPTLVVAGSLDPVTPPAAGLALAEAVPEAELVTVAGAAHLVNLSHPGRFAELVVDHVAGGPAARGMAVRRAVLGDAHVDRATTGASAFSAPFQEYLTRAAWGEVWARPGLDRRTRSAVTLAMLAALGRTEELEFHLPAALANGLTVGEIGELLLQTAVYAGVPAARSAFAVAERLLGAEGG